MAWEWLFKGVVFGLIAMFRDGWEDHLGPNQNPGLSYFHHIGNPCRIFGQFWSLELCNLPVFQLKKCEHWNPLVADPIRRGLLRNNPIQCGGTHAVREPGSVLWLTWKPFRHAMIFLLRAEHWGGNPISLMVPEGLCCGAGKIPIVTWVSPCRLLTYQVSLAGWETSSPTFIA